jgi:hypothetical protein
VLDKLESAQAEATGLLLLHHGVSESVRTRCGLDASSLDEPEQEE